MNNDIIYKAVQSCTKEEIAGMYAIANKRACELEKENAELRARLKEAEEIAELGSCICEQVEAYYRMEKNFKIENCAEAVLIKRWRAYFEKWGKE